MSKHISTLIRFILIVLIGAGIVLSIAWLPSFINYIENFSCNITWLNYTICFAISIPVFIILVLGFYFPWAIERDMIFHLKTAKILRIISILLICDCTVFGIFVTYLLHSGDKLLAPALFFIALIGITVGAVLFILSSYVKRAALLKEEVDATL